MPFFQPSFDDEEELTDIEKALRDRRAKAVMPSIRSVTHNVADKLKV